MYVSLSILLAGSPITGQQRGWPFSRPFGPRASGAPDSAQSSLIVTSTLPRMAFEYVQICSAASTTC
jgi:hypothetical protein